MSEKKKELNVEELENANGGAPYSPPEYDDDYDDDFISNPNKTNQTDGSKRDLDR